ncbi:MAG: hypothetical protein WC809_05120 [Sinimarinibacterium sp.]
MAATACDDPRRMTSPRIILALLLCCALALARVLGVHVHVAHEAHEHATDALVVDHDHGEARIVSELGDHADDHLIHADVDADSADKTSGKLPSPVLLVIAACIAAFLLPLRGDTDWRSIYDPPASRRRSHVLPLSQAPPLAG